MKLLCLIKVYYMCLSKTKSLHKSFPCIVF